jgi:hypothetical protein
LKAQCTAKKSRLQLFPNIVRVYEWIQDIKTTLIIESLRDMS